MLELELFMSAFAILFVIIDPPGCAPIFVALTRDTSKQHQRAMAVKSVVVASAILLLFAFFGDDILGALHIDFDALRIAGGIMLFMIALQMVFEKRTENREHRAEDALERSDSPEDISVFPMGIPMIAGPGTIASLLLLMSEAKGVNDQITIIAALGLVLFICLITFLAAGVLMKLMGKTVTDILTRVLGFLLAALAAQFIIDGINGAFFG